MLQNVPILFYDGIQITVKYVFFVLYLLFLKIFEPTPKVTSFDLKHKKPVSYPLHQRRLYEDVLI